jgi:hypothetical protein
MKGAMARHVSGVSFRRVAFRLAKGSSSTFARALCDDGERVRDKIAASKRKGLWVSGPVPLGYRTEAVCGGARLKPDTNKGLCSVNLGSNPGPPAKSYFSSVPRPMAGCDGGRFR